MLNLARAQLAWDRCGREVALVRSGAAADGPDGRGAVPAAILPVRFTRELRPLSDVRRVPSTRRLLLRSPCIGGPAL
jgi:hypothetical protein